MDHLEIKMPALDDIFNKLANIEQKLDEINKLNLNEGQLLNTKQAAKTLGMSLRTLQEKRRRLEISFIQHGDIVRFRPKDIDQYLMDHFIKSRS